MDRNDGAASLVRSDALLGFRLPPIPPEDQLNVLCDILRQIKATDRHVAVAFDGTMHNVKMTWGNQSNSIICVKHAGQAPGEGRDV